MYLLSGGAVLVSTYALSSLYTRTSTSPSSPPASVTSPGLVAASATLITVWRGCWRGCWRGGRRCDPNLCRFFLRPAPAPSSSLEAVLLVF